MKVYIVVRTQFSAIHSWPDCIYSDVDFLRYPHRHMFYVELKWQVEGFDREKEFIRTKIEVDRWIRENWAEKDLGNKSCEMMAKELIERHGACYASVFEDNENGVEVVL